MRLVTSAATFGKNAAQFRGLTGQNGWRQYNFLMKSVAYVAFLRGINVGGNSLISMEELKRAFASLGFSQVKTVLASGNVLFETTDGGADALTQRIEEAIQSTFGLQIAVMLRSAKEIQGLVKAKPFKEIKGSKRLHVTFLAETQTSASTISKRLSDSDFEIVRISDREVCSAVEVSAERGTSDLMKVLEKEFGKKITTRTWNTVERIAKLLEG